MQNGSEKIEIYLSCRNLRDLDVFSKSDPYVRVSYKRDFTQKQYMVLGKTETVANNLNPNFQRSFELDYIFQSRQDIKFDIFDDDGNGDQDDYIGTMQTTIGALMGAQSMTSILDIKDLAKPEVKVGKLIVRCQKRSESSEFFQMTWRASQKLHNTDSFFDFWDKSDPFVKCLKIRDDNSLIEVCRSEVVQNNLNPAWKMFQVSIAKLLNPNKPHFKIQIWDWEEDGKDQFIGQALISPNDLKVGATFPLVNPKVKNPGAISLAGFNVIKKPSFVDYLRGGLQLNMMIAIDFTGSNGVPKFPNSLHYMNPQAPNQYQLAIIAITQILMNYDSDKKIPAFGFGAKIKSIPGSQVSHCFPLSLSNTEIEASGVQHLMTLYGKALLNLQLSGPTYFGELISESCKVANLFKSEGSNNYTTLLILTDGQIHDMDKTINILTQQASTLPLSIIIVGVGNADFTNMNRLDGDGGLYNAQGVKARDIVQFVPFRDMQMNGQLLAKELLAQLPGQVVQYMSSIGKPPGVYVPLDLGNITRGPVKA